MMALIPCLAWPSIQSWVKLESDGKVRNGKAVCTILTGKACKMPSQQTFLMNKVLRTLDYQLFKQYLDQLQRHMNAFP